MNGLKGAGKDTVGDYLVEEYGYVRAKFAALLYASVAALFDTTVEKLDSWKNDPECKVELIGGDGVTTSLTLRGFLQRYGTEAHRDIFGTDFWVEALTKQLNPTVRYVITDARFDNELQAVRYQGGRNICVTRPGTDTGDSHASEAAPNPDLIDALLLNNGTIEDLYAQVDSVLKGLSS